jgi:hypothetical protein
MLRLAWNSRRLHVSTALPKGLRFNAWYYTTEILDIINHWWKGQAADSTRKLIVHAENARPPPSKLLMDFMDAHSMTRIPHPPQLPDLTLQDFLLFGYVKRQLSECSFDDAKDLLTAVRAILDGFEKPVLIKIFDEWVRRLEQYIETQGEDVG